MFFIDRNDLVQCHYSNDNGANWNDLWVCMKEGREGMTAQFEQYGQVSGYKYGINPHPTIVETDDPIESPYVFYSSLMNSVFLFYVYKGCLLCKSFLDPPICAPIGQRNIYDQFVKSMETQQIVFIDGDASIIEDEIGDDKNIIMVPQYAIGNYNESRSVLSQRIHAVMQQNGQIKIYYKTQDNAIRGAWQNGYTWEIEDMMHEPS